MVVPVPAFVTPPVPEATPENVVEELSPPAVNVAEPSVTLPAPASEPIVWLKLLRSRTAPAPTVFALLLPNVLAAPACKVPALTLVAPV